MCGDTMCGDTMCGDTICGDTMCGQKPLVSTTAQQPPQPQQTMPLQQQPPLAIMAGESTGGGTDVQVLSMIPRSAALMQPWLTHLGSKVGGSGSRVAVGIVGSGGVGSCVCSMSFAGVAGYRAAPIFSLSTPRPSLASSYR